jgi:hypothetical protein
MFSGAGHVHRTAPENFLLSLQSNSSYRQEPTVTTTVSLAEVIREPPTGRTRAVVLDFHDYAQTVFLKGRRAPWGEAMAYSNFLGQAQGVLKSDALILPLDRFYDDLLTNSPDLRVAMGAKSRTGYALRTLLGDSDATIRAVEFVTTFVKTQRSPVILQLCSPFRWLTETHALVGGEAELDGDNAENSAMYVADLLRGFAALPLAGILLDDRTPAGAASGLAVEFDAYSPVANVTENYGWSLAMRRAGGITLAGIGVVGAPISADYWSGDASVSPVLPAGDFLIGEIPSDAVPETVMSRIAGMSG